MQTLTTPDCSEANTDAVRRYIQATATTEPGEWPQITAEFMNWQGGFQSRYVARVRLRIQGKTRKTIRCVTLRRVRRIVGGDAGLTFAVFSLTPPIPPRWRTAALDVTHECISNQFLAEQKQEGK